LDKNGDGQINSVNELFGGQGTTGVASAPGFTELAKYDGNLDGVIDKYDSIYSELQIWRDLDGNGAVDPGELESLQQAGIASITLASTLQTNDTISGNQVMATGSFTRTDGTVSTVADLSFHVDNMHSQFLGD